MKIKNSPALTGSDRWTKINMLMVDELRNSLKVDFYINNTNKFRANGVSEAN